MRNNFMTFYLTSASAIKRISPRLITFALAVFMFASLLMAFAPSESLAATPVYRAVIIGCGDNGLGDAPRNDANAVAAVLSKARFGANRDIAFSSIIKGHDKGEAEIQGLLNQTATVANPNDVFYFYFSGHGGQAADGSCYMKTTNKDPGQNALDKEYKTSELKTDLDSIQGTKVVILDCCFSGGIVGKRFTGTDTEDNFEEGLIVPFKEAPSGFGAKGNLMESPYKVITASAGNEVSWGSNDSLSIFTQSFVQGIGGTGSEKYFQADANFDGEVTLHEAYSWTYTNSHLSKAQVYPENDGFPIAQYNKAGALQNAVKEFYLNKTSLSTSDTRLGVTVKLNRPETLNIYLARLINIGGDYAYDNDVIYQMTDGSSLSVYKEFNIAGLPEGKYIAQLFRTDPNQSDGMILFEIKANQSSAPEVASLNFPSAGTPAVFAIENNKEFRIDVGYAESSLPLDINCYIKNTSGTKIKTLAKNDPARPGVKVTSYPFTYECTNSYYWDGTDDNGDYVPSGTYYVAAQYARNGVAFPYTEKSLNVINNFTNILTSCAILNPQCYSEYESLELNYSLSASASFIRASLLDSKGNTVVRDSYANVPAGQQNLELKITDASGYFNEKCTLYLQVVTPNGSITKKLQATLNPPNGDPGMDVAYIETDVDNIKYSLTFNSNYVCNGDLYVTRNGVTTRKTPESLPITRGKNTWNWNSGADGANDTFTARLVMNLHGSQEVYTLTKSFNFASRVLQVTSVSIPDPVNKRQPEFTVSYTFNRPAAADVSIVDGAGFTFLKQEVPKAAEGTVKFESASLPAGSYTLLIKARANDVDTVYQKPVSAKKYKLGISEYSIKYPI